MPVSTHGPFCQTLVYPTSCWYCQQSIFVLQCTCGSAMLFDALGWPWPKHTCSGAGGAGGIGGSGFSGWEAVDVLRAHGATISNDVLKKIFPGQSQERRNVWTTDNIKRIEPAHGQTRDLLAVVRELHSHTRQTSAVENLSTMGKTLLGLDTGIRHWQITLVQNDIRPNESLTALIPEHLARNLKRNMIVMATLTIRVQGNISCWIVSEIDPL